MAAHDKKWHITQDRAEREKRRRWKRARDRHEKSEKKERRERPKSPRGEEGWSWSRWLWGSRCCEVAPGNGKERIDDEERKRKEERKAKRKEEKQKQRERDEWRRQHQGRSGREDMGQARNSLVEKGHTADRLRLRSSSRLLDDGDSDASGCTARSGYTGISRASSFASSCASYVSDDAEPRRRRSEASESRRRSRVEEVTPSAVKVLNLADLQGQDAPLESLQKAPIDPAVLTRNEMSRSNDPGGPPRGDGARRKESNAKHEAEATAPLSARSGRSEGAVSTQSFRSVASTTVQRYSDQLSGPKKSSAEMKKLVKEFVREMVKGKEMNVLRADGSHMSVKCGLTRSLDTLRIKSGAETRHLSLNEVEKVLQGAPEELSDLETPLDEACATLVLQNECISFKFMEQEKAELFTLCLNLFIDGLRKKQDA